VPAAPHGAAGSRMGRPTGTAGRGATGSPGWRWCRYPWRRRGWRRYPQSTEKGSGWWRWRSAGRRSRWWRGAGWRWRGRRRIILIIDLRVVVPQFVLGIERRGVPGNIGLGRYEIVILRIIGETHTVSRPTEIQTEVQGIRLRCCKREKPHGQQRRAKDSVFAEHRCSPLGVETSPLVAGSAFVSADATTPTKQVSGQDCDPVSRRALAALVSPSPWGFCGRMSTSRSPNPRRRPRMRAN